MISQPHLALPIAIALAAGAVGSATAQRPIELGMDAGLTILTNGGTITTVSIPVSQVRFGFQASDRVTVEPRVSINYITNGSSFTAIDGGVHLLVDLSTPAPEGARPYFTAGAGLLFVDVGGTSNTDARLGVGFGVRLPMVERLMTRLEGRVDRLFDSKVTSIGALFGFSFFTR